MRQVERATINFFAARFTSVHGTNVSIRTPPARCGVA